MLTVELYARLREEFPLTPPETLSCFACCDAALEQAETGDGTVVVGEGPACWARKFYLLCGTGTPPQPNVVYYPDETLTLPLYRAVCRLLTPELRLQRQLARLDRVCLSSGLQQLVEQAQEYLGNPVAVVDAAFNTVAMAPQRMLGIDSWDRILRGEPPGEFDLEQARKAIHGFYQNNITGPQIIPYTEPDGRSVRRLVSSAPDPHTGENCGGLEVIELDRAFEPEDLVLVQRLCQLLCRYLGRADNDRHPVGASEQLLYELLFCEPSQRERVQRKLKGFPELAKAGSYFLAAIPLSRAHRATSGNLKALLVQEYPESWSLLLEEALLLVFPAGGLPLEEEHLTARLKATGCRLDQTVLLSMRFSSLMQLGDVWHMLRESGQVAEELHCKPGCRSQAELFQPLFFRTISRSTNLRPFIHPMLEELARYDREHEMALMTTLSAYLTQECDLNRTAQQLYIHRNTLLYRLKRIRQLTGLDLEDANVRQVARIGCKLWEFYQERL